MKNWILFTFLILVSCQKEQPNKSSPPSEPYDPFNITDVFEREIHLDCSGQTVSDKIERRAAVGYHRLDPVKNIPITSARFTNVDTGAVYVPQMAFPGEGGDLYRRVRFCQLPFVSDCDMIANPGDNRIEYKYFTTRKKACPNDPKKDCYEHYTEEEGIRTLHFTVGQVHSDKVCTRKPIDCSATANTTSLSKCQY